MGIRAETQEEIQKEKITKIFGQPTKHDITKMEKELTAIAAGIPSNLGGGNHGHAGIIVENANYTKMMGGTAFVTPANPGLYPAIAATITARTRAREEALHKGFVKKYKIFCKVEAGLKDIILKAVDNDYVLEIEIKILRFLNQTPSKQSHTYATEEANLTLRTQRNSLENETLNGMETKSLKCTSTVLKKQ